MAQDYPITRHTRQKDAVLQRLRRNGDFVSAQELHRQMNEEGTADTIRLGGQQMFRICEDHEHHHHLVCERCGHTVEIEPPDEGWVNDIAQSYGYTVNSHTVEVFGLCPKCQLAAEREPRL